MSSTSLYDQLEGNPSEQDYIDFVHSKALEKVRTFRQKREYTWFLCEAFYAGHHDVKVNKITGDVRVANKEPNKDDIIANEAFSVTNVLKAIILAKQPVFDAVPVVNDNSIDFEKGDIDPATGARSGELKRGPKVEAAKRATTWLHAIHDKLKLGMKEEEVAHSGIVCGTGHWKIHWDQDCDYGQGEVAADVVPPYNLYVDPLATDRINYTDARYVIYVTTRDIKHVELRYGKKVDPNGKGSESQYMEQIKNFNGEQKTANDDQVMIYECWVKIPRKQAVMKTEQVLDELTGQMTEQEVETGEFFIAYDMKVITCTQFELLKVLDNPLNTTQFPFFGFTVNPTPGEIYGDGVVKVMKDLNKALNRILKRQNVSMATMGIPRLILTGAGKLKMGDIPGGPIMVEGNTPPTILPGVNMASDSMALVQYVLKMIEDVTGAHDVTRGRNSSSITSGRQVALLQSADSSRMGPMIKEFETFLAESAKFMLHIAKEKYPAKRSMTYAGGDSLVELFEIAPEDLEASDVKVEVGSLLSYNKQAQQDMIKEMVTSGMLPVKRGLEMMGIKEVDEIMDLLKQESEWRGNALQQRMQAPKPQGVPNTQQFQAADRNVGLDATEQALMA